MKTITAKSPHDSSFSFSRRYFHWKRKVEEDEDNAEEILTFSSSSHDCEEELKVNGLDFSVPSLAVSVKAPKKKLSIMAVSKLRSALALFSSKSQSNFHSGLGTRVLVGTLFGYRRGHVHFAFQEDPKLSPAFLVEFATPTNILVREMASGLVRIALECDKKTEKKGVKLVEEPIWRTYCNGKKCGYAKTEKKGVKLVEEPIWRTYCNGKKCGYAVRRECGPEEWKVLRAVGPVTMGAGVLPESGGGGSEGELMYMRAKFERVVGSKDSEAFYMMNPDGHGHGGPELSIYLLRV
ncbi:protein MIZU-KUSSEI 1-like isoform X3 [Camellia sinensis]|uniref:protein MIZU-KUSSEI 1-like isoform X3 n=1 Tax=Camellia sinensis TaxID=4442 RepID=UPI001036022C|nr:protein MIZU-KUSSEI 1-like isoform X3 [Camellia sinensis]